MVSAEQAARLVRTFEAQFVPGLLQPLTLVRFPQQGLPDMVYLERTDSAVYPVRRAEVERHWHVFNTLVTEASPPEHTPRILAGILGTY